MSYELKEIKAPRFTKFSLSAFTFLIENRATRKLILPKLFTDAGITKFRRNAKKILLAPVNSHLHFPNHLQELPQKESAPKKPSKEAKKSSTKKIIPKNKNLQNQKHLPSLQTLHRAFKRGKTSPVEVAIRFINEATRLQSQWKFNAIVAMHESEIMEAARESEKRYLKKQSLSIFDGIPVTIKDEINVAGYKTLVGTTFLDQGPEKNDATVVKRLRSMGAIIGGKTNMHEIGIGVTGGNIHHGFPVNPYATDSYSGGSSSGSGVSVGAGLNPISIGADAGGSIRIPASLNGIYGIKPTFGRVSEYGAYPLAPSLGHLGPMALNTHDLEASYKVISGADPMDQNSLCQPKIIPSKSINIYEIKIGIYEPFFNHAQPEIVNACKNALGFFRKQGATLVPITIPKLEEIRVSHLITIASEMRYAIEHHLKKNRGALGYDTRINLAIAEEFSINDYLDAQKLRAEAIQNLISVFRNCDVVLSPATGITAPKIEDDARVLGESNISMLSDIMRFSPLANLTGIPAISFPVGYDHDRKPIGMQAMAAWWQEHKLFAISQESENFFTPRMPEFFADLLEQF